MKLPIYFDHHATTPTDPSVVEAMAPYWTETFGNAGSAHGFGKAARTACKEARTQVARLFGAQVSPDDILFTSGATESNNLAIKGVAYGCQGLGKHIITTKVEHPSVMNTCRFLESQGFEVTYLDVDAFGMVDPSLIAASIRKGDKGSTDRTILISIIGANNEIGTVNPLAEIGKIAQTNGVFFHVDGAQYAGKVKMDVSESQCHFMSMSGHKIYGPKGVGALYVHPAVDRSCFAIQIHGGGQECGLRSGTLAVPLAVGLGAAAKLSTDHLIDEVQHLKVLRQHFVDALSKKGIRFKLNGHPQKRLAGNAHITLLDIEGEFLEIGMKDIAVSSSSACCATSREPSHVLCAIGLSKEHCDSSVRFGFGRHNTTEEIDYAVETIAKLIAKFGKRDGGKCATG